MVLRGKRYGVDGAQRCVHRDADGALWHSQRGHVGNDVQRRRPKHHADDDLRDQRRNASPLHSRAAEPCRREPADGVRRMSDGKKWGWHSSGLGGTDSSTSHATSTTCASLSPSPLMSWGPPAPGPSRSTAPCVSPSGSASRAKDRARMRKEKQAIASKGGNQKPLFLSAVETLTFA